MVKRIKNQKGFTLIELIAVIAILGILALLIVPRVGNYSSKAKLSRANAEVTELKNAIERYQLDMAKLPAALADLSADPVAPATDKYIDAVPAWIAADAATWTVATLQSVDVSKTVINGQNLEFYKSDATLIKAVALSGI